MTSSSPGLAQQVFISHAHEDNDFSRKLASELSAKGLGVWFDVGSLKPGERIDDVVTQALHASDAYVIILSPAAVASHWVQSEWNEALERLGKGELRRFITVLAQPCDIPMRLKTIRWIDFTNQSWDKGLREVLTALGLHTEAVQTPKFWEWKRTIPAQVGIFGLAWSPDGTYLAAGAHDKRVRIWDVASGQIVHTLSGHENWVSSVAWSPDGHLLVSTSQGQRPRVWDTTTGQQQEMLVGHSAAVNDACWSPDGRSLASGSDDQTVRLWDRQTGHTRHVFTDLAKPVTSVAWSPDGKWICASAREALIHLWKAETGEVLPSLNGHRSNTFCVRWSPDGTRLASSGQSTVRIWDWQKGESLRVFGENQSGHQGHVSTIAWHPSGDIIASGSADRTVRLWGADGERYHITPGSHTDWVHAVAWSPDGQWLASASGINDGRILLWGPA
jgi:WD40 repeat protein